jgi:crotonobetainyl-CoA:carnitine CoA-transferase CaiB-like acyl-CoA transferase
MDGSAFGLAFDAVMTQLTGGPATPPLLAGTGGWLPSRLPVEDAAAATVAAALTAAARLAGQDTGHSPAVALDRHHLAAAFRSEAYAKLDGMANDAGFAPLSRFWPVADGWVRTHANYAWHRRALLAALGMADTAGDPDTVGTRLADLTAAEVEDRVTASGGLAVAVRPESQWQPRHPLIGHAVSGTAPPRPARERIRVLDLTRVIAGPVGTRFLAALGAEVLRLDPPYLPELPLHVVDGFVGKRSALLDARREPDRLHALLDRADVLVHGYRPGALATFGLDDEGLAERHPGLVSVQLSAWGELVERRGFDSLVQAASGIALIEAREDRPGVLPCQLLDHGTGYLIAAAALDGLLRQRSGGGTHLRTLSLAATASWLMALPRPEGARAPGAFDPTPWLTRIDGLTAVRPPGSLDGRPLSWPSGLPAYGADQPRW